MEVLFSERSKVILYTLMHRNIKVMDIEMDEFSNITSLGSIYNLAHLPIGTYGETHFGQRWQ